MQRKKTGGTLGAALVACLSMEHITSGFNSQRWKNQAPKAGLRRSVGGGGWGGESWREEGGDACKGGEIAAEMACMRMTGLTVGLAVGLAVGRCGAVWGGGGFFHRVIRA